MIKREESPEQTNENVDFEKEYIYRGLKCLIESGSGVGFLNKDLGHPVYRSGASGAPSAILKDEALGDSPEKNRLFKMLSKLSKELKQSSIGYTDWWYDFSEWTAFCKFAIDVYDKKNG
jgi:hypothetical protein